MTDSPKTHTEDPKTHTETTGEQRGTAQSEAREPTTRVRGTKARAGEASGHIWVLLVVSTALAAAALLGAWWYYFG